MALTRFFRVWAVVALLASHAADAVAAEAAAKPRVELTWVGGATMVIQFNGLTILTDPVLGTEGFNMGDPNVSDLNTVKLHRRQTPFVGVALDPVDLVVLSHAHEDHFDQTARANLRRDLPIILPIADVEAVKAMDFVHLDGLRWGETREFTTGKGRVTITATIARHSRNSRTAKTLGAGNGYWIEFSEGDWKRTMYWTGDTLPTPDVIEAIRSRGKPDLMVPHVGGVGTAGPLGQISMGASDVVTLAGELRPGSVLPIHHSTYAFYRESISELVDKSKGQPYRLVIVKGTTTLFENEKGRGD